MWCTLLNNFPSKVVLKINSPQELFTEIPYVKCAKFGVTYLLSKKHLSGRETRWLYTPANFDTSIAPKPGKEILTDSLSPALDCSPFSSSDDIETNASLGSVIAEFCQDVEIETNEPLFKVYQEDAGFMNILAKLEEDSNDAWKKR